MYEELGKPLRELALDEPLAKRARRMTDVPVELPKATVNNMTPVGCKNFLLLHYSLAGNVFRLNGKPSDLTIVEKNSILRCLKFANGIKMVRVAVDNTGNFATLEVHFFNVNYLAEIVAKYNGNKALARQMFPISGGSRVRAGEATGQVQVDSSSAPVVPGITLPDPEQPVLNLIVRPIGDYSTYTLELRSSLIANSLFDPLFSEIRFKFRPGCFNTNCAPDWDPAPEPPAEPAIDYLAKDYGSFRQTMVGAMMDRVPGWEATSEADLDMVLADLFSVAADEISDYQDRVMNEAYLTSARKRVSLARHSRMMDYHIHQGSQASTWLAIEIEHHGAGQKFFAVSEGVKIWTGEKEEDQNSVVFLSRHKDPVTLHQFLNSAGLYTWSDTITSLKAGSTSADLKLYNRLYLDGIDPPDDQPDQAAAEEIADFLHWFPKQEDPPRYLLIHEHLNPETGFKPGVDPSKRQLLQLLPDKKGAVAMKDPITDEWFVRIRWRKEDALRRDYCFTVDCPAGGGGTAIGKTENISLFHGNLIEVFHGRQQITIFKDEGEPLVINVLKPLEFHYARTGRWGTICRLPEAPLAYRNTTPGGDIPPVSTLDVRVGLALNTMDPWDEVPSLVYSDDSAENGDHFIVETDENRRSLLRFGNGENGRDLPESSIIKCTYQYGDPLAGNVGSDRLTNLEEASVKANPIGLSIHGCWNPFDVTNGRDREPVAEIVRRVPEAYRARQLRAVTLKDYVDRAQEIEGVSRAAARYAWTGSWRTVRVVIDPVGTNELSHQIYKKVESYLNAVRLIGEDIEIRPPAFVPLEIMVRLCAAPGFWPEDVRFVLEQEFSAGWTPDGRQGFFHPDLWTFGQPLYASQIIGRALQVRGVEHVVGQKKKINGVNKTISVSIKRWNSPVAPTDSLTQLNFNEIIQVMNDPDHQERGTIAFEIKGGRQ